MTFSRCGSTHLQFQPQEAEAGRFLSLKPDWPLKLAPGHPGLPRETLSQINIKENKFGNPQSSICDV